MQPLSETEIRQSFVNCSKGEAKRLNLPRDFAGTAWSELDFLGWRDQGAPDRGYLVVPLAGAAVGLTLRVPPSSRRSLLRTSMCSLCTTRHPSSGVTLFAARKEGAAGRRGNTVGTYICADLACSLYIRGRRTPDVLPVKETLSLEDRIARVEENLAELVDAVRNQGLSFDSATRPPRPSAT
ncbi:FBP domain-containing protein [Streptomyces sp. XM4193]|uniref:FBP domain-containing protein n=1 Tax=Streptomyces sp. XM4193 TaxID=2929782 RepID=UPI001FF9D4C7|nr:FBP domain-containing protein [Streptomyces sp. XM4193]MCK1798711.1 FBP domain-containing protein [Streptomyces sp. XM4193]